MKGIAHVRRGTIAREKRHEDKADATEDEVAAERSAPSTVVSSNPSNASGRRLRAVSDGLSILLIIQRWRPPPQRGEQERRAPGHVIRWIAAPWRWRHQAEIEDLHAVIDRIVRLLQGQPTFVTAGMTQEPFRIEGSFSSGQ